MKQQELQADFDACVDDEEAKSVLSKWLLTLPGFPIIAHVLTTINVKETTMTQINVATLITKKATHLEALSQQEMLKRA